MHLMKLIILTALIFSSNVYAKNVYYCSVRGYLVTTDTRPTDAQWCQERSISEKQFNRADKLQREAPFVEQSYGCLKDQHCKK